MSHDAGELEHYCTARAILILTRAKREVDDVIDRTLKMGWERKAQTVSLLLVLAESGVSLVELLLPVQPHLRSGSSRRPRRALWRPVSLACQPVLRRRSCDLVSRALRRVPGRSPRGFGLPDRGERSRAAWPVPPRWARRCRTALPRRRSRLQPGCSLSVRAGFGYGR